MDYKLERHERVIRDRVEKIQQVLFSNYRVIPNGEGEVEPGDFLAGVIDILTDIIHASKKLLGAEVELKKICDEALELYRLETAAGLFGRSTSDSD